MKQVITLNKYEKGTSFISDENPLIEDKDYCEIITTRAKLTYSYEGIECSVTGNTKDTPKNILIAKAVKRVIFDEWYEHNWTKTFQDIGMEAPVVYDHEEDNNIIVNGIDDFINNCKYDDCYDEIIGQLTEIAEKEIIIEIIDKT